MKLLLLLAFAIGGVTFARASTCPAQFYPDKESISAAANTAFAGGSMQELEVDKKRVAVLYRYASGGFGSDAAIYLEEKGVWLLLTYYAPILKDSIEAFAVGQTVVLKTHQKKQVLLTVSVVPER